MERDDGQVGRMLNRREALGLIGASSAAMLVSSSSLRGSPAVPFRLPACIVRPRQTEGPYFVDAKLERADIRSEPAGGPCCNGRLLNLAFRVSRINQRGCTPLTDALVDVWQCDAMGVYSGVKDINGYFDTVGKQFLRGYQVTDAAGTTQFQTIYPGWYQGRTVHIHFKVRTDAGAGAREFTSQLYFDDAVTDRIYTVDPYVGHEGRRPRNSDDAIFRSGGDQLLVDVAENGNDLSAVFDIGLQID